MLDQTASCKIMIDSERISERIYDKITHWFEMIEKKLHDSIIVLKNVHYMNEMKVIVSMLDFLKVKREMMTAIKCSSKWSQDSVLECLW